MGADRTSDPIFGAKDRENRPAQSKDRGGNTQTKNSAVF